MGPAETVSIKTSFGEKDTATLKGIYDKIAAPNKSVTPEKFSVI